MIHRQFRGSRAAGLFPVLAYEPDQQIFVLDDLSLGFGFVCEPLASADRAQADRLSVLMNLDWPAETLVQIALWASPDIEERLARMQALRIGHGDELLRASTQRRAAFLRAGTEAPLGPASELRLRDLQVIVTVKLPIAEGKPTPREITDAAVLGATALQVLKTAGLRPVALTADRYVRLMSTLLNWDAQAGWRDRIVPECDPDRLIREQFFDLSHALEVDAQGLTLGTHRAQTFSVKRFPDRVAFGMAARYIGDGVSGTRGIRHNVLITLSVRFPDPEALRTKLSASRQWATHQALGQLSHYLPTLHQTKTGYDGLFQLGGGGRCGVCAGHRHGRPDAAAARHPERRAQARAQGGVGSHRSGDGH